MTNAPGRFPKPQKQKSLLSDVEEATGSEEARDAQVRSTAKKKKTPVHNQRHQCIINRTSTYSTARVDSRCCIYGMNPPRDMSPFRASVQGAELSVMSTISRDALVQTLGEDSIELNDQLKKEVLICTLLGLRSNPPQKNLNAMSVNARVEAGTGQHILRRVNCHKGNGT